MAAKAFSWATRVASVLPGLLVANGPAAWAQDGAAMMPIATPEQVTEALNDCIRTDGMRDKLEAAGWKAEPPSGNGMTLYRKAGSGAMMPLFAPNGEMRCWVMSRTDQPSARYVEAVTALLGPPGGEPSKPSGLQAGDGDYSIQWNAKGYGIPMDIFKTPQPGLRIEVWRLPSRPEK